MRRNYAGLLAASAVMVFGSAITFSSMGVVLYAMRPAFHWSESQAGNIFTALILVCCITHLLPVLMLPRLGGRITIVSGALVLAAACALAATTSSLAQFTLAACLVGTGFSMVANTPSIYLITGWFGPQAPRMIGLYMMLSTLGGALGPPMAHALVASQGGWQLYWRIMAATALILAAICAIIIREPATAPAPRHAAAKPPGYRETLRSFPFMLLAAAMVATQLCIITVASVTPSHLVRLDYSSQFAAHLLGAQGFVGTLATGASGWLTHHINPRRMLTAGLLTTACGMALLALAASPPLAYGFALLFGIGWATTCLAITVLLVAWFDRQTGTAALATIWTLAGAAALGPAIAGRVADATGSFTYVLLALGALMLPIAAASTRRPALRHTPNPALEAAP